MNTPGVFLRGLLMGAADIVPGVSGGTVAFITGIYDTLLGSIRAVDLEFLGKLLRLDIKGAWAHVNGGFLKEDTVAEMLSSPGPPRPRSPATRVGRTTTFPRPFSS